MGNQRPINSKTLEQIQSRRSTIQPGFPPYQAFTKENGNPGESIVDLVGEIAWLNYSLPGLGLDTPDLERHSNSTQSYILSRRKQSQVLFLCELSLLPQFSQFLTSFKAQTLIPFFCCSFSHYKKKSQICFV